SCSARFLGVLDAREALPEDCCSSAMGTDMAFCANCGKEISDQAPSCPQCGHPQRGVAPFWTPAGGRRTDGYATASLILAISSFVVFPLIPAIVAVILGSKAKQRIAADPTLEGEGMAKAGVIVGWVNVGIW